VMVHAGELRRKSTEKYLAVSSAVQSLTPMPVLDGGNPVTMAALLTKSWS